MTAGPKRKEAMNGDKNIIKKEGKNPEIPAKTNKIPRIVEGNNFLYVSYKETLAVSISPIAPVFHTNGLPRI